MRILMAIILAAVVAAPAVAAGNGHEQGQISVQTADLDLATKTGQRALNKRLTVALERLCGSPITFTRDELAALNACEADARQMAAPQIDAARARLAVSVAAIR